MTTDDYSRMQSQAYQRSDLIDNAKRAKQVGDQKRAERQINMSGLANASSETANMLNKMSAQNDLENKQNEMINRQVYQNQMLDKQVQGRSGLGNAENIIPSISKMNYPVKTLKDVVLNNNITSGSGTLNGALHYSIPGAVHGQRGNTDSLIVHRTAGHGFHPNDTRLTKDGLGAHLTITRDGKVHQVGSLNDKMWHAGPNYNNRSIGMEVTGKYINGAWEPMTDLQKASVDKYGRMIVDKYKIPVGNIRHHASVAAKTAGEGLQVENYLRSLYLQ